MDETTLCPAQPADICCARRRAQVLSRCTRRSAWSLADRPTRGHPPPGTRHDRYCWSYSRLSAVPVPPSPPQTAFSFLPPVPRCRRTQPAASAGAARCRGAGTLCRPAPPHPSRTLPFHSSSGQMERKYNVLESEEPSRSNLKSRANISPCICQGEPRATDGGVAFPSSLPHRKAKNDKECFSHHLITYSGYIKKGEMHLRSPPVTATKARDEFCIQNICTNYQHSSPLKALGGMDGVSPGGISPHCFPCTIHKYTCARVYFYQRARTCIHGEKTYKCLTLPVWGWRAGAAREGLLASLCRRSNTGLRCSGPAACRRWERALSAQGDRHHSLVKRKTTLCRCNRPGKERNVPNANGD